MGGLVVTAPTALREMRLSAMKHELVSNVSHELRGAGLGLPLVRDIVEAHGGRAPAGA